MLSKVSICRDKNIQCIMYYLHNFTIENNGFITLSAKMHLMEGLLSRG